MISTRKSNSITITFANIDIKKYRLFGKALLYHQFIIEGDQTEGYWQANPALKKPINLFSRKP